MTVSGNPEIKYRASAYCSCACHKGKGFTLWHSECSHLHSGKKMPAPIEITAEQFAALAMHEARFVDDMGGKA